MFFIWKFLWSILQLGLDNGAMQTIHHALVPITSSKTLFQKDQFQ